MSRKLKSYNYLIGLFEQVDNYLSEESPDVKQLPVSVVNFCVVAEKVLKLHLYKKNKILPYDASKLKDADQMVMIALGKQNGYVDTIHYPEVIQRFKLTHKKAFTDEEYEILKDLYNLRNQFVHSYRADSDLSYDSVDIVKKMGTLWSPLSKLTIKALGKKAIKSSKPKKTYTEWELKDLLIKEVKKKINQKINNSATWKPYVNQSLLGMPSYGHACPRCGAYGFEIQKGGVDYMDSRDTMLLVEAGLLLSPKDFLDSGIYKCLKCNLELTEKEYELYRSTL